MIAECRARIAVCPADSERTKEAGHTAPIGVRDEAEVDSSDAVDEPHCYAPPAQRSSWPAPVLRFDVWFDNRVWLVHAHVKTHPILGHPGIGTENEHRTVDYYELSILVRT